LVKIMLTTTSGRRRPVAVPVAALAAVVLIPTAAVTAADKSVFFEETAEAFWAVPHDCADGTTVVGTLLVRSTRDFETPETEDEDPTARVQFLAVCPDGTSFRWGAPAVPATITSARKLRRVTAAGTGVARDILGGTHEVTFDVVWTGAGPLERTVNAPGSIRKQRSATATGRVTFDGEMLTDGDADHPTRPDPFIRVDIEKSPLAD
jgi:hypothetical protein